MAEQLYSFKHMEKNCPHKLESAETITSSCIDHELKPTYTLKACFQNVAPV